MDKCPHLLGAVAQGRAAVRAQAQGGVELAARDGDHEGAAAALLVRTEVPHILAHQLRLLPRLQVK